MFELSSYIPQDRRQALLRGVDLPDHGLGAALMADVSGFTPLAEALAGSLGRRRGAEELTALLNRVFEALIAEVEAFGGSVIGFAGDAIICWFDATPQGGSSSFATARGVAPQVVRRALGCALHLQRAMAPFEAIAVPGGGRVRLTAKVAVVAGPARRFLVGEPEIQRVDVLAGRTIDRLGLVAAMAAPGEALADSATLAMLGPATLAAARRDEAGPGRAAASIPPALASGPPGPAPSPPAVPDAIARRWVLPAVRERLGEGAAPLLAELRPASVLMIQFGGIDYDSDPDAGERLDRFVRQVQRELERDEGVLVDIMMADKGGYLYAAFGAPIAHEDDAARALRAALALRAAPPAGLTLRIGVSRGTIRAGPYGSVRRRAYGILGDAANLAHRLMSLAAPGEVLASAQARVGLEEHFAWEALPPVRVKGKAEPVAVFRPLSPREPAPAGGGPGIRGRQVELEQLSAALRSSASGSPRLLLIEGEAGIGKSRLVAEAARLARAAGYEVLLAAGRRVEQQTPYHLWRDLLALLFRLREEDGPEARRAAVLAQCAGLAPDLIDRLPLLSDVLDLDLPPTDLTRGLSPQLRAESLDSLVGALLQARLGRQPLLLVLDDAHWLDTRSWQVAVRAARSLLPSGLPLLMLVVMRPIDALHPALPHTTALLRLPGASRLVLGPVEPEALAALAAARLGVGALPRPAAMLIQERAAGNPLFAEQLAAALQELGTIRVVEAADGTGLEAVLGGDIAAARAVLPDTLQSLLLARIDRQPPAQQLTLKVAAVIGPTFSYQPLRHARARQAAIEEPMLREQLRTLAAGGITALEAPEPDLAYSFRHILLHEAAYQTLLHAQRRELHRSVAEWYEQAGAGASLEQRAAPARAHGPGWFFDADRSSLGLYDQLLAHHYRQAEDREREAHYAGLAGIGAADRYANAEAVAFFSRALELTPEEDRLTRFDLVHARLRAGYDLGDVAALARDADLLAEVADACGQDRLRAMAALQQGYVADIRDDPNAYLAAAERALAFARSAADLALEAAALNQCAQPLYRLGRYPEARAMREAAYARAREADDRLEQTYAVRGLALIAWRTADYPTARRLLEETLVLFQELGDRQGEAQSRSSLGTVMFESGDLDGALQAYLQAVALGEQIAATPAQAVAWINIGNVHKVRGVYGEARAAHERALALARSCGFRQYEAVSLSNLGQVYATIGAYAQALPRYLEALELHRAADDRRSELIMLASIGGVHQGQGEFAEALASYREALAIAEADSGHREAAYIDLFMGDCLLAQGAVPEACEHFARSLAVREELGQPRLALDSYAAMARGALAAGDLAAALDFLRPVLSAARADPDLHGLESPLRAYLTCCRVLAAAGDPEAASCLRTAHALLQRRAATIADPEERRGFLEHVPDHREILSLWAAAGGP